MLTINGRLRLLRVRWHCETEGSETPTDCLLDEAEATISEGVREMACRLNQDSSSFAKSAANLQRTAHVQISKESLRQLIEAEGQTVLKQMQGGELPPDWSSEDCQSDPGPTRVYFGCDGVKVPLVTDEEKKKRRQKVREKRQRSGRKRRPLPRAKVGSDNAYKDFKVAYFYNEDKSHRLVGVSSGNHEAAGRLMRRMALQIDLDRADEKIALIDGAPWIRNQIEFHGLTQDIGLDFYHLQDNAQKAKRVLFGGDAVEGEAEKEAEGKVAGTAWVGDLMHTFKHDGYDAAWEQLTATRQALDSPRQRRALDGLMQYAAERRDMIRYPEFGARGWQIGSGPTEAECKTTTQRVKGRGRRWDGPNAEAMMALAALHDSGLWNQHWTTLDPQRN